MGSEARSSTTFVDNGYAPGDDFRLAFISSPVFTAKTLAKLAPRRNKQGVKTALADVIAKEVAAGRLTPEALFAAGLGHGSRYLALRKTLEPVTPRPLGDVASLVESFGEDGWHGPIGVAVGDSPHSPVETVYVYTQRVAHYDVPAAGDAIGNPSKHFRWMMMARLHEGAVSVHWDNFTHNSIVRGKVRADEQFQYWHHVDAALDKLAQLLGASWAHVPMFELVYDKLWGEYDLKPEKYGLLHLGINAESEGVALEAESSARLDLEGLRALARRIAVNNVDAIWALPHRASGVAMTPALVQQLKAAEIAACERSTLQTMLQEWGTNSYGFKITTASGEDTLLHVKVYMGARKDLRQSLMACSLAHLRCYAGGSIDAARFLVKHL